MFSRSLKTLLALLLSCLLIAPGASGKPPKDWTSRTDDPQTDGFGSWVEIRRASTYHKPGVKLEGELIAIDSDSLYVFGGGHLQGYPKSKVTTATVLINSGSSAGIVAWGLLGAISTLSHGYYLAATLPAWIMMGIIAGKSQGGGVRLRYPDVTWDEIAIHARFPQGLPQGVDLSQLMSKQVSRASALRDSQVVRTVPPDGN